MITFGIAVVLFIIGMLFFSIELDDLGGICAIFAMFIFIVNCLAYPLCRADYTQEYYELEKARRHIEEYSEEDIDSINEYIYKTRYNNRQWFSGQYIPDEIDTIPIFKKDNIEKVWDTILKQADTINSIK